MLLRPIIVAAFLNDRHPVLVRRWVRAGLLTSACDVRTRQVLVDLHEVEALSATRQTHRAAA